MNVSLSAEQKQAVAAWVAASGSLSIIQKKLAEQFKIPMTYMDIRLLVDDLGLELKNAVSKADASDVTKEPPSPAPKPAEEKGLIDKLKGKAGLSGSDGATCEDEMHPKGNYDAEGELKPKAESSLSVEIDRVVRPNAVVSGTVKFSSGVSTKWTMDQYGRLIINTSKEGYKPSTQDVQAFQRELSQQLQHQGY